MRDSQSRSHKNYTSVESVDSREPQDTINQSQPEKENPSSKRKIVFKTIVNALVAGLGSMGMGGRLFWYPPPAPETKFQPDNPILKK